MLDMIRTRLRALKSEPERGDSEVITSIFMIPFAVFLIFAAANFSMYWEVRSSVQNVARDGARSVSLYGGNGTAGSGVPLNKTGKTVAATVKSNLWSGGKCTRSNCTSEPQVRCGPERATAAGETVYCEVTYYYSPVANDWFGFDKITTQPFKVREQFVSETGY